MAKYSIDSSTLSAITDSIRRKNGTSSPIKTKNIASEVDSIESSVAPNISVNSASGVIIATAGTKVSTKQLSVIDAQTITPGTSDTTIASGSYLTGTQTIKGDSNLTASNIKKGVSIFGVNGSYEGMGIGYPNGTAWTQSNITSGRVSAVLYGDNVWVAIVDEKDFYQSIDGKSWTKNMTVESNCDQLYYWDGVWLATGSDSSIYRSIDGTTWTEISNTIASKQQIYYANGLFHLVSYNGLYYSYDGIGWTQVSNCGVANPRHIFYGKGLWILTGSNGSSTRIVYSKDGITSWTQAKYVADGEFDHPHYAKGIWHVYHSDYGLYWSTDGKTWTRCDSPAGSNYSLSGIWYSNGIWLASGMGTHYGMYYSLDGKTWQAGTSNDSTFFGQVDHEFAVNANGVWITDSSVGSWSWAYYSFDGKTWQQSRNMAGSPSCCHNANGIWVMGTTQGLVYSVTWEP